MSCVGCHQLRAEISDLKTFISRCFDKVFTRFDDHDAQFANLRNLCQKDQSFIQAKSIPIFTENVQTEACVSGMANIPPFNSLMVSLPYPELVRVSAGGNRSNKDVYVVDDVSNIKMEGDNIDYSSTAASAIAVVDNNNSRKRDWTSTLVAPASSAPKKTTPNSSSTKKSVAPSSSSAASTSQQRTNWRRLEPDDPQGVCPYCFKRFTRAFSVRRHINKLHPESAQSDATAGHSEPSYATNNVEATAAANGDQMNDGHDKDVAASSSAHNNNDPNCWPPTDGSSKYF